MEAELKATRKAIHDHIGNDPDLNPVTRALCERLKANGKNGKAITCAAMHKLIHLAFAILKYGEPFDPNFHLHNVYQDGIYATIYLITSHKKGISSCQLTRDIKVTQKTAWFMLHRIREAVLVERTVPLTGTVEIDETYVSDKEQNKHASKRTKGTQGAGSAKSKTLFRDG